MAGRVSETFGIRQIDLLDPEWSTLEPGIYLCIDSMLPTWHSDYATFIFVGNDSYRVCISSHVGDEGLGLLASAYEESYKQDMMPFARLIRDVLRDEDAPEAIISKIAERLQAVETAKEKDGG